MEGGKNRGGVVCLGWLDKEDKNNAPRFPHFYLANKFTPWSGEMIDFPTLYIHVCYG